MNKRKTKQKSKSAFSIISANILFVVTLVLLLLTILAPFTPPDIIAIPAFLGIMILPILILTIVVIVILALLKHYCYFFILLFFLLISFPLWRKSFVVNFTTGNVDTECESHIKVMTYNVEMFSTFEEYGKRFEEIKNFILKKTPTSFSYKNSAISKGIPTVNTTVVIFKTTSHNSTLTSMCGIKTKPNVKSMEYSYLVNIRLAIRTNWNMTQKTT